MTGHIRYLNKDLIFDIISEKPITVKELMKNPKIKIKHRAVFIIINQLREERKIIKTVGKDYDLKHPIYKLNPLYEVIQNDTNN